jgi:hypothetical protein
LLVAVGAVGVAVAVTRDADRTRDQFIGRFVCPMHREVTATRPGQCPICRMALEVAAAPAIMAPVTTPDGNPYFDSLRKRLFSVGLLAPAWVTSERRLVALLHADQLAMLAVHEPGRFAPSAAPEATVAVHVGDAPPARWDDGTQRIELEPDPGTAPLKVGEVGWLQIDPRAQPLPVILASAILQSPEGPYVLVAVPERQELAKRPVQLARFLGRFAVVLAGLEPDERVLVRDAFFYDAERRLQLGPGGEARP